MSEISGDIIAAWLAARAVIMRFLADLDPGMPQGHREDNAAALLARLAAHDPPILLDMATPDAQEPLDAGEGGG